MQQRNLQTSVYVEITNSVGQTVADQNRWPQRVVSYLRGFFAGRGRDSPASTQRSSKTPVRRANRMILPAHLNDGVSVSPFIKNLRWSTVSFWEAELKT